MNTKGEEYVSLTTIPLALNHVNGEAASSVKPTRAALMSIITLLGRHFAWYQYVLQEDVKIHKDMNGRVACS
jgi:hypothetical protein